MTPNHHFTKTVQYLVRCTLIAAAVIVTPAACVAQTAKLESNEVQAARRFGDAIQLIDWSATTEGAARESIELAIQPFGWRFKLFVLRPLGISSDQRMVSDLTSLACPTAATWAAGMGLPTRISLLGTDQLTPVTQPAMIDSLINGKVEWLHGPVVSLYYPIRTQSRYQLAISGTNDCFDRVLIRTISK